MPNTPIDNDLTNEITDWKTFLPNHNFFGGVHPQAFLQDYTTFQLGGPCRVLLDCQKPDQLIAALRLTLAQGWPYCLIGGGSNLLVSDHGLDRVVIRYATKSSQLEMINKDQFRVAASVSLDQLALDCATKGWDVLNFTSGIPGTLGGAIVGNAGAFGRAISENLLGLTVFDPHEGALKKVSPEQCDFSYRHSKLKFSSEIVVSADFKIKHRDPNALLAERQEWHALRSKKHPDLKQQPCAGSFFRNIEPSSQAQRRQAAGWFLEQAGAKSLRVGEAYIFEKHANMIIKGPNATAQNVYDLSCHMQSLVTKKAGIDLKREVRLVGHFNSDHETAAPLFW